MWRWGLPNDDINSIMGDMNNKQNLANCPNAFKVTLDKPCEICGRIRMIRSDIGICIPCIQKKYTNPVIFTVLSQRGL